LFKIFGFSLTFAPTMNYISILGFVAGVITSAGMIPQVVKTWRTKKVDEISLGMYSIYIVGFILWLTYGFLKKDYPILCTNSVSLLLSSLMVVFKLSFGSKTA
jgi:MtN3 and saliva related transmembrane protein